MELVTELACALMFLVRILSLWIVHSPFNYRRMFKLQMVTFKVRKIFYLNAILCTSSIIFILVQQGVWRIFNASLDNCKSVPEYSAISLTWFASIIERITQMMDILCPVLSALLLKLLWQTDYQSVSTLFPLSLKQSAGFSWGITCKCVIRGKTKYLLISYNSYTSLAKLVI